MVVERGDLLVRDDPGHLVDVRDDVRHVRAAVAVDIVVHPVAVPVGRGAVRRRSLSYIQPILIARRITNSTTWPIAVNMGLTGVSV